MRSPRLTAAFEYARAAHDGQRRKGTAIPYISHLMSVSALVMEYGGDYDQAIAGLLHDVLEDCGAAHEATIRARFGERVATIVRDLTDGVPDAQGRKEPWRLRKERFLARTETMDEGSLLVSVCDKLHNARTIGADLRAGHDVFARFNSQVGREGVVWYYRELVRVFRARLGEENPLFREFEGAVGAIFEHK
ncbi:MAG TPA: HD domain-containing protein [Rhizomicrobium sp.]|nr:HD domain-containing protein [Rhizomicrobium sp.]